MHSIRRGAAFLEPVVALGVAASIGAHWLGAETDPWTPLGYALIGMLGLAGLAGIAGLRIPPATLLRAALAIGLLVLAAALLLARPLAIDAWFGVLAIVFPLALPGRLAVPAALLIAAGFAVGAIAGTEPLRPILAVGGAALVLMIGLAAAWSARRTSDPNPDLAPMQLDGGSILEVAFATAAGGLALLTPDARVMRANEALADMLGRSPKDLAGTSWWAHLGPADVGPQQEKLKAALSGEIWSFHLEARLRTRDRRLVAAVVGMSAIADATGEPELVFVQVANIDDRVRNEVRLRTRATETRRSFDLAPVPMWEIGLEEIEPALERWQRDQITDLMDHFDKHPDVLPHTVSTLDIKDANQAAKSLVGADGREEFIRGIRGGRLGPGFVAALGRHLDALWRGRTTDERIVELLDFDGTTHSGMLHMTFIASEDDESAASMLVAFMDLGDHIDGREAVGALDARLRAVVATAPVVLFATDVTGLITVWEGKAVADLGFSAGEIVGRSMFEVFGGAEDVVSDMRRALDGDGFFSSVEIGGRRLEAQYSPVFERGRVAGVVGLAVDITGREPGPLSEAPYGVPMEAESPVPNLEEPEAIDPSTVATFDAVEEPKPHPAADDLEALLDLDSLLPEFEEPQVVPAHEEPALLIEPSGLDLSDLGALLGDVAEDGEDTGLGILEIEPDDLTDLPFMPIQTTEPARSAIDLWDVVGDVIETQPTPKPVATNQDDAQAKVFGDAEAVREILAALIENAEQYGGPHLTVRVDRLETDLALSVIDDGDGLPAPIAAAVFGPESGIGTSTLSSSRRSAAAMGGELTYDYRHGHSVLTLSLPAV